MQTASSTAAYDVGFVPSAAASKTKPKFVYLLDADDFDPATIPPDAFVVYQGHHGDLGAQYADVCLPGLAYTEKSTTWVNTEGRSQLGRTAVSAPGAAREDWKIVRAVSETVGQALPYDDIVQLRNRMWDVSPTLVRYDEVSPASEQAALAGLKALQAHAPKLAEAMAKAGAPLARGPLKKPIQDFYLTGAYPSRLLRGSG